MTRLAPATVRLFHLLAFLLIVSVVYAVYSPALDNEFVNWDDYEYIHENPMIHKLDPSHVRQMFQSLFAASWHPLTWISHALDYKNHRLDPKGHHFTNVVLHALNVYLVFLLFRALWGRLGPDATLYPPGSSARRRLCTLDSTPCAWSPSPGFRSARIFCAPFGFF